MGVLWFITLLAVHAEATSKPVQEVAPVGLEPFEGLPVWATSRLEAIGNVASRKKRFMDHLEHFEAIGVPPINVPITVSKVIDITYSGPAKPLQTVSRVRNEKEVVFSSPLDYFF
jgi:hypothetical protein